MLSMRFKGSGLNILLAIEAIVSRGILRKEFSKGLISIFCTYCSYVKHQHHGNSKVLKCYSERQRSYFLLDSRIPSAKTIK